MRGFFEEFYRGCFVFISKDGVLKYMYGEAQN
jgi:hypothetical protein